MKLIFATGNQHKVDEIQAVVGNAFEIITMKAAGIDMDIPEPYDNLEANAREKSATIFRLTGLNCFGEDTGLEVEALNGEPGVKSARYAGEDKSFEKNTDKLLTELKGVTHRKAQFRTVISLQWAGKEYLFEGVCPGTIIRERRGAKGFGYDPVFVPTGSDQTFAEMTMDEKNLFSHRKKAVAGLIEFLNKQEI